MEVIHQTDDYDVQRGLEEILNQQYPDAALEHPPHVKRRVTPISTRNASFGDYVRAGIRALLDAAGQ